MDDAFYERQRDQLGAVVDRSDVAITTAMVPGRRAPVLVSADAIGRMRPGSVVVDLAAGQGGNCEPTEPDREVQVGGAVVLGPTNLPATIPFHASQMLAKNLANFTALLIRDGRIAVDTDDEILRGTLAARDGRIVHPAILERLGREADVPLGRPDP
jgi:NAD(P) transhydrogenase subunit alpha